MTATGTDKRSPQTEADVVVVSVFVNPLQFPAKMILQRYPRTRADCEN